MKDKLNRNVRPAEFSASDFDEFTLNENTPWVRELLMELNENAVDQTPQAYLDQTHLTLKLKLKNHFETTLGHSLLAQVDVESRYATSCTFTLKEVFEDVAFSVEAAFLPGHLEDAEEYRDQTELYLAGSVRELYFMKKNQADLYEFIHEHIVLNMNPYPKLDDYDDTDGNNLIYDDSKLKN